MKIYNSVNDLVKELNNQDKIKNDVFEDDLVTLLQLLEKVNPCNQQYELCDNSIIISYDLKINLLNFKNIIPLNTNVQIIGMPISISQKGYFGNANSVINIIERRKGLKLILNSDVEFKNDGKTLSTFVFKNRFSSFNEYLNELRSPYRRRINKALNHRNLLTIRKLDKSNFNENHYNLYLSIMERTENPLETLKKQFFLDYDAEIFEFIDNKSNDVVGFIQIKEMKNKLHFLFGGFKKESIKEYDIYYNMLLKIIELGIEKQVEFIEFGQTAEECKFKIGCKEIPKYMYVHHSNPILNFFIQKLVPLFSYKPYSVKHHVFKA
jgi:hypothetical protein